MPTRCVDILNRLKPYKKESCLQDSPPAAGRLERQLPFRRSAILPGRAFYVIGNSNGISYYIKNCPQVSPMDSYHLIRSSQCLGCAFIYTSRIRLIFMLKYTWVVEISECPSISWTLRMSAPFCSICTAKECLNVCGVISL